MLKLTSLTRAVVEKTTTVMMSTRDAVYLSLRKSSLHEGSSLSLDSQHISGRRSKKDETKPAARADISAHKRSSGVSSYRVDRGKSSVGRVENSRRNKIRKTVDNKPITVPAMIRPELSAAHAEDIFSISILVTNVNIYSSFHTHFATSLEFSSLGANAFVSPSSAFAVSSPDEPDVSKVNTSFGFFFGFFRLNPGWA